MWFCPTFLYNVLMYSCLFTPIKYTASDESAEDPCGKIKYHILFCLCKYLFLANSHPERWIKSCRSKKWYSYDYYLRVLWQWPLVSTNWSSLTNKTTSTFGHLTISTISCLLDQHFSTSFVLRTSKICEKILWTSIFFI